MCQLFWSLFLLGLLGVTRTNCLNCPRMIVVNDIGFKSKPNSLHVSSYVSCNNGIRLWSITGNKWCNVWSLNVANDKNILLIGSFRSTLVFIWWSPQSTVCSLYKTTRLINQTKSNEINQIFSFYHQCTVDGSKTKKSVI